jgi:ketosteroid isomerase-like protein
MTRHTTAVAWLLLLSAFALGYAKAPEAPSAEAIRGVVARYARSIDTVDTDLASQVWAEDEDISFIHPMGHERGWTQIKTNLYEGIMGAFFSARKLSVRDVSVKLLGDAAVVEFYWSFEAKLRKDGSDVKTQGRETQVLRKDKSGSWRIVHIHYSGMPPSTPPGGGL